MRQRIILAALLPVAVLACGGCGPGTAMESGRPEAFLQSGHVVEFKSPRIGLLRSRIVAEAAR